VINPTQDLHYTPIEGEIITKLFSPGLTRTLIEDQATLNAIKQSVAGQTYLHFSCHGYYNWQEVMHSGLVLADQPLTLAEIMNSLDLTGTRLVTLSACETGLTEFRATPDEYIGLPAGFLQAGAPGVISTLWAVNDLSTMLLMERFYQNHLRGEMGIAEALRTAQLWLRDVTAGELKERFAAEAQVLLGLRVPAGVIAEQ
jgi:CHAT domain-containing protein